MPRVRSRKRTNYNFLTRCSDKEPENLQIHSPDNESFVIDDNVLIEFLPPNNVLTPPSRSAKERCHQKISEIIDSELTQKAQVLRERTRVRRATESCERRAQRLERLRQRASQRIASESSEQREQRLEKQRRRNARRYRALEEERVRNRVNLNSNFSLDQGTDFKPVKICKLCLILIKDENFKMIEGSTRDVFEFLFSNTSLDGDNQIICNDCSIKLFEAHNFRVMCLETEDIISSYVNTSVMERYDLGEIYAMKKDYKDAPVVSEGHQVCRLCMQLIEHDVVPLREVDKEMIREFIPEMNLDVTIDPIICKKCHDSFFAYSNFLKSCLNTAQGRLHSNDEIVIDTHTIDPIIKTEDIYVKRESEYEKEGEPYETEFLNIKSEQREHESDSTAEDETVEQRQ